MPDSFRYLGITDECTDCEKCGKPNLKSTVVLQYLDADGNDEGDPAYFGSTCAARALSVQGGGRRVLQSARWAHHETLTAAADARSMLELYGMPAVGPATEQEIDAGAAAYQHYNAHVNAIDWRARAIEMLARKQAAVAAATKIDPVCPMCGFEHKPRKRAA